MRYENQTFVAEDVTLDGNEFEGCTFVDCSFWIYASGEATILRGAAITGKARFVYGGPAERFIKRLADFYRADEKKRALIEQLFVHIRQGTDPRATLRQISWAEFRSADARNAVQALMAMYHGLKPNGPVTLEDLFEQVRGGSLRDLLEPQA